MIGARGINPESLRVDVRIPARSAGMPIPDGDSRQRAAG
jgi:hypothetical protein